MYISLNMHAALFMQTFVIMLIKSVISWITRAEVAVTLFISEKQTGSAGVLAGFYSQFHLISCPTRTDRQGTRDHPSASISLSNPDNIQLPSTIKLQLALENVRKYLFSSVHVITFSWWNIYSFKNRIKHFEYNFDTSYINFHEHHNSWRYRSVSLRFPFPIVMPCSVLSNTSNLHSCKKTPKRANYNIKHS